MLNCAACGVELRPGARFCDMCGAKVVTRCPACGAVLRDVARFCDLCGTPLSEGAVAPEATVAQPLALSQRPASAGVAAGRLHTVAWRKDGSVLACGDDQFGQCQVAGWTDIVSAACGKYHTVGLRSDGTVVALGDNTYGQCAVEDWSGVVALACGRMAAWWPQETMVPDSAWLQNVDYGKGNRL